MIVLFTSNFDGGILQLSIQIMNELKKMNMNVCCFVPKQAQKCLGEEFMSDIILYEKFSPMKAQVAKLKRVGNAVLNRKPQLVWYMDNFAMCTSIGLYLSGKVKQLLILHDIQPHLSYDKGLRTLNAINYARFLTWMFLRKGNYLLLMSHESYVQSLKKFPRYADKMLELTLGAHLPESTPLRLKELNNLDDSFLLFFGRLDKYKGIVTLLKAYALNARVGKMLVIAGKGTLTEEEQKLIIENSNVILINRYIEDGEIVWLFQNAQAVVLPYIEASQSGIIPIAYLYGVPVITSDVAGLVQYVEDRKTGIICRQIDDYVEAFQTISQKEVRDAMSNHCKEYYKEHMDWEEHLKELLNIVLFN